MLVVCAKHTMANARNFVEDRDIDIAPRRRRESIAEMSLRWIAEQEAKREREREMFRAAARRAVEQRIEELARLREADPDGPSDGPYKPSFAVIQRRICKAFGITQHELVQDRRCRELVYARQAVMYWTARLTTHSLPMIGRGLGGRDHTTVIHGKDAYIKKRRAGFMGHPPRNLRDIR